jgi:hypothetical protein
VEGAGGREGREDPTTPAGRKVGLATFDLNDPYATFEPIEPVRPPRPRPFRIWLWPVRVLAVWLVNLVALAAAGLVVTTVGTTDPLAYVTWATVFGAVNASGLVAGRLWRGLAPAAALATAIPFLVNLVLVWLMTVTAPPFHSPNLPAIAKAAAVMWLVNLPLRLLFPRRARSE